MTTNAQVEEWLELINASLSAMTTPRQAYTVDEAPLTGSNYVTVQLARQYGGYPLLDGSRPSGLWRLIIRAIGGGGADTGESNANTLLDRVAAAIENKRISISDVESSSAEFESREAVGEDEAGANIWSGITYYTYGFDAL